MVDPMTALGGARWNAGIVTVQEVGPQGMITIRGDLSDPKLVAAVQKAAGVNMPGQGTALWHDDRGLLWMSSDELLMMCPYDKAQSDVDKVRDALGDMHSLVVDVSDARASFLVQGASARDVLAKVSPVDFAPGQFESPMFRRTRLAQVPVALWMKADACFQLICFRSQAQYVFDVLTSASKPGSEIGLH